MAERGERIHSVREKMNTVEDELFGEFCAEIGVDNIRWEHSDCSGTSGGSNLTKNCLVCVLEVCVNA